MLSSKKFLIEYFKVGIPIRNAGTASIHSGCSGKDPKGDLQEELKPVLWFTMPELWLKADDAAGHLAVSRGYLKRFRIDYYGGFLLPRKHYIFCANRTASIVWNVDAVR